MKHVHLKFSVEKDNYDSAGMASSKIKKSLNQMGLDNGLIRRIAVAAYEAEINLVIHSIGGSLQVDIFSNHIEIVAEDNGPGIVDIDRAMSEGYSTANQAAVSMGFGAGMGLPNMRRCADEFKIISILGAGTTIKMTFNY